MNAIELLETQHKEVKALLAKVVEASGAQGARLLEEISQNLLAHMIIEQEIFYPAVSEADLPDVDEGYEEHHLAREEINRAMQTKGDKTLFQARCKVIKELVEHHADEEEDDMFAKAKKALDSEELERLGTKMELLFKGLKALDLPALARRAEEVEVLAQAGGEPAVPKKTAAKRAPAARRKPATRQRTVARRNKAGR